MAGVLNKFRQSQTHMPSCSMTDCKFALKALVDWHLGGCSGDVSDESETECAIFFCGLFFGDRSLQKECAKQIPIALARRSPRSVKFDRDHEQGRQEIGG